MHNHCFVVISVIGGDGGIQDVSVPQGDSVIFTCNFIEADNNVTIKWTVDNVQYICVEEGLGPEFNGCFSGETQSTFQLKNTSLLDIGSHSVQCILEQNIPESFQRDPSFDVKFNSLISTGQLIILEPPRGEMATLHTL